MKEKLKLELQDLSISLKIDDNFVPIVKDVNLKIFTGKVLALVGESGCGKSVTAMALLRLLPRELQIIKGKILFNDSNDTPPVDIAGLLPTGRDIRNIRGGKIAMIFQEPMNSFSPLHTIGNQIMEVIRLHKNKSKAEARVIAVDFLKKVGIGDPEKAVDRYPHTYSGGMRQRAMIARALCCNPSILIADEPTTALDVTIQTQVLKVMKDMQMEFGTGIVFITHNIGVVAQMADDVAIMYMGEIIEQGSVKEILKNPLHPYTKNLLKAVPRLGDLEARKRLEPIKGTVPSLFERPKGCLFSPRCEEMLKGQCDQMVQPQYQVSENHFVSCFQYEKLSGMKN
ncbi:MAG: ABC transporter ATP-binding protein [Desulfobacula sp.]|uniref:ABC transporter ATP-binding protein n=1 Tax=Desulfobacula sp. TaxID=2593537 RepID=UPI0025C4412F|nr:ABC transporter ATP-binding protein [Desulfobacula sp.]MCD4718816.1 ABC transporter ATP-binding protein [Desulfobacula sp.]